SERDRLHRGQVDDVAIRETWLGLCHGTQARVAIVLIRADEHLALLVGFGVLAPGSGADAYSRVLVVRGVTPLVHTGRPHRGELVDAQRALGTLPLIGKRQCLAEPPRVQAALAERHVDHRCEVVTVQPARIHRYERWNDLDLAADERCRGGERAELP